MKEFIIFVELRQFFPNLFFVYASNSAFMGQSTPTIAFDTLPIQCRHIEHMHEGVFLFLFAQILLKSSFQN